MSPARRPGAVLVGLAGLSLLTGCGQQIGALLYISGAYQKTVDKQVDAPKGSRLAILVDYASPDQANPIFARTLQSHFERLLVEKEVDIEVVPFGDAMRLRGRNKDFDEWPVSRVGRELDADYVMCVRVTNLRLQKTPDVPLLEPSLTARMKVIAVDAPEASARVWPAEERDGEFSVHRPALEYSIPDDVDREAIKLARGLAWHIARPFFKHDPEEKPPLE